MSKYTEFYDDDPWVNINEPCYPEGHRLFLNDERFWISMNENGQRCFFVHEKFDGNISIPENLAGIKIELVKYANDYSRLVCSLISSDPELESKFNIVTKDIAFKSTNLTGVSLFSSIIHLIRSWANFLKPQRSGLSNAEYIGLWGELYTLSEFVIPQTSASDAIRFWVGPEGKKQDFTLNNLAIEVKTTLSSESRRMTISSLEQLDKITERLFIFHIIANPSDNTTGHSLKALYQNCRDLIGSDLPLELLFLQKITDLYGKATERQLTNKNLVVSQILYEVDDSFPALRTKDVPSSIVAARYDLLISAIKPFTSTETIEQVIKHG
ncbi:hypothetical protein BAE46_13950 [Glaciecola punicea]|uniref:PD-(D/E)XK motif protein n=1 Tax=Glaciecola punicea TaxID=56804 RepID=UPI000872916F|nr:PD-(D/E)XK motif protein [Glaciecola punicea]OFA29680.1 hypothetical protein BAE46_13950 [Glaciecola punicea]